MFSKQKQKYLEKLYEPDKSKKGNVDKQIKYIIDKINSLDDYYTTSSCAGRIVLLERPDSGKKQDVKWLFTSHETVSDIDLNEIDFGIHPVWFKQESFIIHVCAKDFDSANTLLIKARNIGFKRSGLISKSKRYIVEIMSTDSISTPIYFNNKIQISKEYLDILLKLANEKMLTSRNKIKKLYESLK